MSLGILQDPLRHSKAVGAHLEGAIANYFNSPCFASLKRRIDSYRDMIDGIFPGNDGFASSISFPMYAERYHLRRAFTKKNYKADPFITLDAIDGTPVDAAQNMTNVLNQNFRSTMFRSNCFDRFTDRCSRFGCFVVFHNYEEGYRCRGYVTVSTGDMMNPYQRTKLDPSRTKNIVSYDLNPLNYFQDPTVCDPELSPYRGFIDKWSVPHFLDQVQRPGYIRENVEKVAKMIHAAGGNTDTRYVSFGKAQNNLRPATENCVYVYRVWAFLPLKGNEDDPVRYYVEMVNGIPIRIQENYVDYDIVPLTCGTFRRRDDFWWGNTDGESILSHQNFVNFLLNMKAEHALRMLDRIIFVNSDSMDWSAVNKRHERGGIVPIKSNFPINQAIADYTPRDTSTNDISWILREVKESAQSTRPMPNFQQSYNQGGLNNKTATAAGMQMNIGDILEDDLMTVFEYSVELIGYKCTVMLQQYLGDRIGVRQNPNTPPQMLDKYQILGHFNYKVKSTYSQNNMMRFTYLHNFLTGIMNFRGTGDPSWMRVNLPYYIKQYLQSMDLGNVDEGYPDPQPQLALPGMGGPGMGGGMGLGGPAMPDLGGGGAPQMAGGGMNELAA